MAKKCKYYVVWKGVEPGIYDNWEDCEEQVATFPGARYKSFPSYEAAVQAFRSGSDDASVLLALMRRPAAVINYADIPDIDTAAIAVDAACAGNPGPMEYRGVEVGSGRELFHIGPLPGGTNNIGEYLALVHALALCARRGETHRTIYSDSRTAQSWLRRRGSHTQIVPNSYNARVFALLSRADAWVRTHELTNPVVKWRTDEWGEIPADFNRK